MLVTYIVADRQALLSIIADPDRFYAATPYTFLVASLIVLTLRGRQAVSGCLDCIAPAGVDASNCTIKCRQRL